MCGCRFSKAELMSGDLLEEIPVKVHNSHLVHAYLYELREDKKLRSVAGVWRACGRVLVIMPCGPWC